MEKSIRMGIVHCALIQCLSQGHYAGWMLANMDLSATHSDALTPSHTFITGSYPVEPDLPAPYTWKCLSFTFSMYAYVILL